MLDGLLQPVNPQSGFVDDLELTGPVASTQAIPTLSNLAAVLFALVLAALAMGQLARP